MNRLTKILIGLVITPLALVGAIATSPAAQAAGPVTFPMKTAQGTVNVRSGPGTTYSVTGTVAAGSKQTFDCYKTGTAVNGDTIRGHLSNGKGYVTDSYINEGGKFLNSYVGLCPTPAAASTLKIAGQMTVPNPLTAGTGVAVTGTVSSNYTLKTVTAQIKNTAGTVFYGKTANPNALSFNLNQWDSVLLFSKLPAGSYTYTVTATDASSTTTKTLQTSSFSVKVPPTPVTTTLCSSAKDCAQKVLNNANITFSRPGPKTDLTNMAATGTTPSVCGSLGRIAINTTLLNTLLQLSTKYKMYINNFNAGHDCLSGNSIGQHPRGDAVDFNGIKIISTGQSTNWGNITESKAEMPIINQFVSDFIKDTHASAPSLKVGAGQLQCSSLWNITVSQPFTHFNDTCTHLHMDVRP